MHETSIVVGVHKHSPTSINSIGNTEI